MPPRRATVSAIRRPDTAVMFATTTGMVVPLPSPVARLTSSRDSTDDRHGNEEHVAVGQVVRHGLSGKGIALHRFCPTRRAARPVCVRRRPGSRFRTHAAAATLPPPPPPGRGSILDQ